jgi:hypothetical protein
VASTYKEDADVGKANGRSRTKKAAIDDAFRFPAGVAGWILANAALLDALVALRLMGSDGEAAVEELLAVRAVAVFRASIELYYQLALCEGLDPQYEMEQVIPEPVFDTVRHALWGMEDDPVYAELHLV